jgi:hypothetical protein
LVVEVLADGRRLGGSEETLTSSMLMARLVSRRFASVTL